MAVDPTISLQGNYPRPTQPQGIDLASIYGAALKIKQQQQDYAQQQQAVQKANSLRAILSAPGAVDPATGKVTNNALKALWSADTDVAQKVISSNAQIDDREAQAAKYKSDASIADMKRNAQAIRDGLAVYRASTSEAGNDPGVAKDIMMDGLRDHLKGLGYSPDRTAAIWGKISTMEPAQLEALATSWSTAADSAATEAARDKRTLVDVDGQTLAVGGEADPSTGAVPVTDLGGHHVDVTGAHIEKIGTTEDPTRAAQGEEGLNIRREQAEQGRERIGMERKKLSDSEAEAGPNLTPDAINMAAEQIVAGDPSALRNIGRGKQGAADLAAIRNKVAEIGAGRGLSGEDLANIDAEFKGQQAGETYLGRRGAQLSQAGVALDNLIAQSKAVYDKLPRGDFVPYNQLAIKVRKATSSPEELAAYTADQAVINQWAKAINPTGQLTVHNANTGSEMLSQATSREAHDRVLEQMRQEIQAEKQSLPSARSDIRRDTSEEGAAPKNAGAAKPPVEGARKAPDGQWYVQKDGKWFRVD